jgi:5'-3' exonuclease
MQVHLVDGTYELFRYYHAVPSHVTDAGEETAAVRGVLGSMLGLLEQGATHIGIATDHVVESFRNDLWPGYKSSAGIAPDLLSQFPLLEDALVAAGFVVWPMVEYEADDALAAAAAIAADDPGVDRILICTPDKDLGQCVVDERVVQFDRRKDVVLDHDGIVAKFGVRPDSIPDYLAVVGDSADGFPGLAGWGAKSAAAVLARYPHLEDIPAALADWDDVGVRNASRLLHTLLDQFELALLFRRIATLERDAPTIETVDELRWTGPTDTFAAMAERIDAPSLVERAGKVAADRA